MPVARTYSISPRGLGTEFPEDQRPSVYASQLENRFIGAGGGAERRQGMTALGATITNVSAPNLKSLHEMVQDLGTAQQFVIGAGRIYRLSDDELTWGQVYSGLNTSAKAQGAQMDDKLIIVNGTNRNIYTTDGSAFRELVALMEQGQVESTADGTAHDTIKDGTRFANWVTETEIAVNDLVFDASISAFAMINTVLTSALKHTPITAASEGFASGRADLAKAGGDRYEIHDLTELNIVPVASRDPDNLAVAGAGSTTIKVQVTSFPSGFVNFARTQARIGDYLKNTTRNQGARITSVSGNALQHTTVAGQVVGDSLVFLKSAMPIANRVHVHYGRAYYIDSRDRSKARISGPGDPQDMTTDQGTLDSLSFRLNSQQPTGDELLAFGSFQQYLVIGGRRNVYLFSGRDPIEDTSADSINFSPTSLFPQGLASRDSLITIGNDGVILTPDGVQSFSLQGSQTLPTREDLSQAIRTDLQGFIDQTADKDRVRLINYPRRNWILAHTSGRLHLYNYSPSIAAANAAVDDIDQTSNPTGSWALFTGRMATMNDYFVKEGADLIACDSSGRVWELDESFGDGVSGFATTYQTAWLPLDENRGNPIGTRKTKALSAVLPIVEGSANLTYTIAASAPYNSREGGGDSVTVVMSAQESPVVAQKVPVRARGERVRLTFSTPTANVGPDNLTEFTVIYSKSGIK